MIQTTALSVFTSSILIPRTVASRFETASVAPPASHRPSPCIAMLQKSAQATAAYLFSIRILALLQVNIRETRAPEVESKKIPPTPINLLIK